MNAFQNWEYVDRLIEEPRMQLAQELIRANPLILADPFYVNRRDECCQFHKDLMTRWDYPAPSERVYVTLVDHIYTTEQVNTRERFRNLDWGEAGEMHTAMPQGINSASADFHEIVFHAFEQGYLGEDWLDNLNEMLGGDKVRKLFEMCPGLYLAAPLVHIQNGPSLPKARKLCHSDVCLLLKILDEDATRLAMLGLMDEAS